MNNLIYGIITTVICTIGYVIAFKLTKKNNFKSAIMLVVLCGFALRIYTGSDLFLHEWDEKYHALVAKHLMQHPLKPTLYEHALFPYDIENWVANHIWLEKPPVPLWLAAISMKVFGTNEIALRIPSLLASTLAIFLTFLIGNILFNKRIGFIAAFLHSINGLLIEVAGGRISSDMVETWFVFFVEAAIYVSVYAIQNKKSYSFSVVIGILMGSSLLSKWSPGLLVLPVWFVGAYFSKRYKFYELILNSAVILISSMLILLPWLMYAMNQFPEEGSFVLKKFLNAYGTPLEEHTGPVYYYLTQIRILFGELIYVPILITIFLVIRSKTNWKLALITSWWIIPLLIFSFAATKRQTYLLISAPAYFIMIGYTVYYLIFLRRKSAYPFIANILVILLMLLPARYCIERIKPFEIREREPANTISQRNIKNQIRLNDKTILFNIPDPVSVMFYNDCIAYPQIPDKGTIHTLIKEGYTVIVNDNERVDRNNFKGDSTFIIKKVY